MSNYTLGLDLAWQIAAAEATHAQHEFIEPEHLFIGLCKLEDFAAPAQLRKLELSEPAVAALKAEIEILTGQLHAQAELARAWAQLNFLLPDSLLKAKP